MLQVYNPQTQRLSFLSGQNLRRRLDEWNQIIFSCYSGCRRFHSLSGLFTQLEKRGTILGDQTAGKVMISRVHDHEMGVDTVLTYAASVTEADVIMSDGKSLEQVGVTPDEISLPTGENLRARQDPVLLRAAALLGVKLDPVAAGKLFPFKWMP